MFKRWQRYVASGTITGIETANLLAILPGSPLEHVAKQDNYLFMNDNNGINLTYWINPKLPNYDFKIRVKRHIEVIEEAIKYKWPLWNGEASTMRYLESLKQYNKSSKKYVPILSL